MRKQIRSVLRWMQLRRKVVQFVGVPVVFLGVNAPPAITFVTDFMHQRTIHSAEYEAEFGRWDVVELPADQQVNAIHTALLPTGKLLIVAGSGNERQNFDAGTFRTLLYDPATGQTRDVLTPVDLFCGGHAFLADGKLLVAGGTQRYEVLQQDVKRASGKMVIKNESPAGPHTFDKGTEFTGPDGRRYRSVSAITVPAAVKTVTPKGAIVAAAEADVLVESVDDGTVGVNANPGKYAITGLAGDDVRNLYGMGQKMTMDKQDYQGIADSYEFDPATEEYVRVGDMTEKRWYPSLVGLPDGGVLAVSGLDGLGQILPGQNEVFDPATKTWTNRPDLFRYFPTYPALFQTARPGQLFYSGSVAGFGPATQGRAPGFWDLTNNGFTPVGGLRDPDLMETSGSTFAGPVQNQRVIVAGGGGVGESPLSTARIDVIDLKDPHPHYVPGPDLPAPTRYPNLVQLPDDSVLISGGSQRYRGRDGSDVLLASLYHPGTNTLTPAADPTVGRDYHSEGILMPNGQVVTLGGNSLFSDAKNTKTAQFEKRLEIYTPPYLFHGPQPAISAAPTTAVLGSTMTVSSPDAASITAARLIRPSAVTHATDLEQRSVALGVTHAPDGSLSLAIPGQPTLVTPGYYMLFLLNGQGTPSVARWVHVS